jgi:hypothetical protein
MQHRPVFYLAALTLFVPCALRAQRVDPEHSLYGSGRAALSQRYLQPALEAVRSGGGVPEIANAIADAGFNSEYDSGIYGRRVWGATSAILRRQDCP